MGSACSLGLKHSSIGLSGEDGHTKDDSSNKSKSVSSAIVYSSLWVISHAYTVVTCNTHLSTYCFYLTLLRIKRSEFIFVYGREGLTVGSGIDMGKISCILTTEFN